MQPVLRKVRDTLRAELASRQAQRYQPSARRLISALMAVVIILATFAVAIIPSVSNAANTNVIFNGGFESGFSTLNGCGLVGTGWNCFTNGGAVNTSFHDDQWEPTVAEGTHSQLVSMDTKGVGNPDADRYAGIFQTVRVVDWQQYTLSMQGMIRTTQMDGDPYRYVVQVGWTWGPHPNWQAVTNWDDTGWYTYYPRTEPGDFSSYNKTLTVESDYVTVYIRVWKKWGAPDAELDVNLDAITFTGPTTGGAPVATPLPVGGSTTVPLGQGQLPTSAVPAPVQQPYPMPVSQTSQPCTTFEYIYNGNFEQGFNQTSLGEVGRGWGAFNNGGAARYGYHADQWDPVVWDGAYSQLLAIDTIDISPADADRYVGIYQQIGQLTPGAQYELTINGILRGDGGSSDPYRYVAQWGLTPWGSTDWTQVAIWTNVDIGSIYPREEPGDMQTYRVSFIAPSNTITLFIRGWSKWPVTDQEMNLNLDGISLRSCAGTPPPQPPTPPVNCCLHIVQPGETLSIIARMYNTTVWTLATFNNIANPNIIFVGQQILIPNCDPSNVQPPPPPPPPPPTPPAVQTYVVQPGDTLSGIARHFGVTTADLAWCNGITNWDCIYVGQILKIP